MSKHKPELNLPSDCHLAYIVWQEAWYSQASASLNEHPHLMVSASARGSGGGVAWEFQIDGYELGGSPVTRVKMFEDSYAALTDIPEFFAALAEERPVTLDQVRAILDSLGAVDETERVSPYPEHQRETPATLTLAEIRSGTGWPQDARFILAPAAED